MENIKSDDFKLRNKKDKLDQKELSIFGINKKFFSADQKYIDMMLKILVRESDISIRILDWFVTNYSKKNNIMYLIKVNGRKEYFNVNNEYKNQLNSYSKVYFDPFCRQRKIIYCYKSNDKKKEINFVSSIGQLNFFRWAIQNKIIKYVQLHLHEIEKDMKKTTKKNKKRKLLDNKNSKNTSSFEEEYNDDIDPIICSSDNINTMRISPAKKTSSNKSSSNGRTKRQQLSKSAYDIGIKKSNRTTKLDFN